MSNFEFTPSKNYDLLLKQAHSLAQLVRAMQAENFMLKQGIYSLESKIALIGGEEIQSLRATNENLTNDLLKAEAERDALKLSYEHMTKLKDELLTDFEPAMRRFSIENEICSADWWPLIGNSRNMVVTKINDISIYSRRADIEYLCNKNGIHMRIFAGG